jgi:peptide/nickel transport system permease protein
MPRAADSPVELLAARPEKGRSLWADAARRLRRDRVAVAALMVICLFTLIALLSRPLIGDWEDSFNYDRTQEGPSAEFWLGTDQFGRSILQKTLLASRTSMSVGVVTNLIAVPLGMFLGAVAGYYGGWLDDLIVWLYSTLASIPGIIRLMALQFAFKDKVLLEGYWLELDLGGLAGLFLALGVMSWIGTCRLVRAETLRLRELDYVLAARAAGRGGLSILLRHVVPNVLHIGIISFSLGFVGAISAEVILSYLNLGVQTVPSWGRMINSARADLIVGKWWELAAAVVPMFLLVLAWNLFGDRLRDALDPRLKNL